MNIWYMKINLGQDSRWAIRQESWWPLSFDWLLDTEETLELRTKPNVASRAGGRVEKPGGRKPDWPGLNSTVLGGISLPPDLFNSPWNAGEKYTMGEYLLTV